ncbi:vWA domain-containing protein [Stigmatella aurantiaca]|uniref:von Willebrand factor, type A n=1 Tax=Stigmatella aurantiaca (strain DW4/3-1) TaxID=378806 RepID=Q091U5_STIAD|nr:VWA domain-containing protein [Stigmatella aurantiaca]ADO71901.1 Von Willebrand factor, type A [Stigmatella aurantiaca DW4/3-1]EAU66495.1 von Willebrand factor, type A [Stigmatella aurantiaca DW4/3-1]
MSPTTQYRLPLWGSAFLGLSLMSSCMSAKAPSMETAAHDEATSRAQPQSPSAALSGKAEAEVSQFTPPPPPPAAPAPAAKRKMDEGKRSAGPTHANLLAPLEETRPQQGNTFEAHQPHAFTAAREDALSTFAVDVDTASYTLARRYLNQGSLPPPEAVRVEEFVNYFKYQYAPPDKGAFTVHLEGAPSPFDPSRHFLRVGVQGKVVSRSQRKPAHLVFLVDTSGSMHSQDKLPLAKEAMKVAVRNLNENDTVAIVTYAGSTQDVLPPTPATEVQRIHTAIDLLQSGGGTAMGSGMELAYRHAVKKASGNAISRVIVLTDGDANIGPNLSAESMLSGIEKYVAEGVTLSTIGFGMGNYRDDLMERLADKGNGNCFYVDSYQEAKKVFEAQLTGTLEVIAKDVKIQVEFNPEAVRRYRLVGYENRDVADRDFRNDKVDAGEIGAGHNVTALYEVELTGEATNLATVRIRAKAPQGTEAAEQSFPFSKSLLRATVAEASTDFRFALAVASAADILRASPAAQGWNLATARTLAEGATEGKAERTEFVKLVSQAQALRGASAERGR